MRRTIPRGWLQRLLPAASRGSRAAGLPAMLGAPWQPDEPRSSRGRQLQLHWLSGGSTGWGPRPKRQRWVQAWRCMWVVDYKAVGGCTAPRKGGQAAHSFGPARRSLAGTALIRLHQPAIQTMRPGHGRRARRLHPAGRRWSLDSWQVSCCQAGCIRAAYSGGYPSLHDMCLIYSKEEVLLSQRRS